VSLNEPPEADDKVETTTFAYPPTVPTGAKVDAPFG